MSFFETVVFNLPEVASPTQRRLSFKEKIKWTLIVLVIYFVLGMMPLFGIGKNQLNRFEYLAIILGAEFGSIISLGIGPIVTASIILQLLNGSNIIKFDLTSDEGKKLFQGVQKLLSFFFILFEAIVYVFMGGLSPADSFKGTPIYFQLQLMLVFQLILGGVLILYMDEVTSKWGIGSGISLFIAGGVSKTLFIQAFNWMKGPVGEAGATYSTGAVPALFQALAAGDPTTVGVKLAALVTTVIVFAVVVYVQAMKVEIPLSFGRIRGQGIRWPLSFIYTSNIPVILVAALTANLQLMGRFIQNWIGPSIFGRFSESTGELVGGFLYWIQSPNIVRTIIEQRTFFIHYHLYIQAIVYILFITIGSVIFSIFWVQTSGMDAKSQAEQMMSSGMQVPGFRRDERVLENILNRYIWPLTVMGGATVGFLAAFADLSGSLSSGMGILLAVMIIYQFYEEIARQHMMDMNPMMRRFMGG